MSADDAWEQFVRAANQKYARGVVEHRGGDDTKPFAGCVFTEYSDEQLDSFKYLEKMLNDGTISREEAEYWAARHMEAWLWVRTVKERR